MCSVVAGLTALGGALSYKSQQAQAEAQANAYRAQAAADEQNAQIENRKQEQIADNYAQQQKQLRTRQRLSEGQQRAAAGAAGLGFGGSQLDILSSSVDAYRQDSQNLLTNQRNDNYSSRVQETNYINSANADRQAASNVMRNARWQGISTILGTAASVYGMSGLGASGNTAKAASAAGGVGNEWSSSKAASSWSQANYNFPTAENGALNYGSYKGYGANVFGNKKKWTY